MRQALEISDDDKEHLYKLCNHLPYFCEQFLSIKVKNPTTGQDGLHPLVLNRAQIYIHDKLQAQLKSHGKVRSIIGKARQFGSSTYVAARYYHKTSLHGGRTAYIIAHDTKSTNNLFDMVKRFNESIPVDSLRPTLEKNNERKLKFAGIDSEYFVGTAGSKNTGRSTTIHYFHGSEVAYWENTADIQAGAFQAVSDADGTEVILESTSNGMANMFYKMTMSAIANKSDYQLIFLPWFWHDDYEREVPRNFQLSSEESEIADLFLKEYNDETILRKLAWRRSKIDSLESVDDSGTLFKREYPATIHESFETSGDSLVRAVDIVRARKSKYMDFDAPVVFGVDPGRTNDRTVIVVRRGREICMYKVYEPKKDGEMTQMRLVGILTKAMDSFNPVLVNIDAAHGHGVVDRLNELGYRHVRAVHFASRADEDDIYVNKRAEMAFSLRKWFMQQDINIPDKDEYQSELVCVPNPIERSDRKIKLIDKSEIIKEFGKSPDLFDATMLTFAFPVHRIADNQSRYQKMRTERPPSEAKWKKKNR